MPAAPTTRYLVLSTIISKVYIDYFSQSETIWMINEWLTNDQSSPDLNGTAINDTYILIPFKLILLYILVLTFSYLHIKSHSSIGDK